MSDSFALRKLSSFHPQACSQPSVSDCSQPSVSICVSYRAPEPSAATFRLGHLLEKIYTGFVLASLLEADSLLGARKTLP